MKRFVKYLFAAVLAASICFAADGRGRVTVTGRITDSSTGKGIAGVPVTDGYSYVRTDASGRYKINPDARAVKIYYTTPSAYEVNLDATRHIPLFYSEGDITSQRKQKFDFVLTPLEGGPEKDFTLIMIGDPQCRNKATAARYAKETIPDIKATADACPGSVYAVTLGDITFDSSNMWDRMASTMSNVSTTHGYLPFFQCMGNHDHNSLEEDTDDDADDDHRSHGLYVKTFGPSDYSFDRGDVHIVVMDDIIVKGLGPSSKPNKLTWNYATGFTDEQLEWLRQDLACVDNPQEKVLMLCVHAPLRGSKDHNQTEVLRMMWGFKEAHVMAGHTHTQLNYVHNKNITVGGTPVYEHVHGTACGGWWANNTNLGGSPCGYNVYTVSGANVASWRFKGTGCADDYQFRVYDGSQTYTGDKNIEYRWYDPETTDATGTVSKGFPEAKGALVAEVFDDDFLNWNVEMWIDGVKAGDFIHKKDNISNVALAAYFHNVLGRQGKYWCGSNTPHYWYFPLPEGITAADLESGEHTWEVRAVFTVPTNKANVLTYTCSRITRDYSEF